MLLTTKDDRGHDPFDRQHHLHPEQPVGIEHGPDHVLGPFAIARGDHQGMADLAQQGLDLVRLQGAAERILPLFLAGQDDVAQLRDDVLPLAPWQER